MDKKLFKTREDIYKKCPSIFWEVSIFGLVFGIASAAFAMVFSLFSILTFALLFFPMLFATFMTLFTIKYGGTVTVKSTFAISLGYYRRSNFGCFRLLRCFGHAFLVDLIASSLLMFILQAAFKGVYGDALINAFNEFEELYAAGNVEAIYNYLAGDNCFATFYTCLTSFSISISIVAFVFGVAFNSVNVYLCSSIPGATAAFSTAVFKRFLKDHINSYRKDFWSLNWPLILLLIVGIAGGYALVFGLQMDYGYGLPISSMIGIAFMIPFAPFFFAGMEALFAKYNPQMKQASMDLTQGFLNDLKDNVNISEEDRQKIEELLNKSLHKENDVPLDFTTDNQNTNKDENDDGSDDEEK